MHHFLRHPFFRRLLSLDLPPDDFAVAGSGPLYARGLIKGIGDLDLVARGAAWARACTLGEPVPAPYSTARQIVLFDGEIEILDAWFPEIWTLGDLIDGADLLQGIRFVPLDVVRRTKLLLNRPNDLPHLAVLRRVPAAVRRSTFRK